MGTDTMFDLSGKVAVVSGSNDGIGQGIAIGLAEAGADIVALHRSDISGARRQVEALGRRIHTIQCDLSDIDAIAGATFTSQAVVDALNKAYDKSLAGQQ